MNISHDSKTGESLVHDVLDYPLLQKAAIALNFSIKYVEILLSENITLLRAQEATKLALQENHLNVNLLLYAFTFHDPEYSTLQIFSIYGCIKSVAIAPVIRLFKLSLPWYIICYIFVVPVIAFIVVYSLRVFRVIRRVWKLFEILQVLLGIPVSNVKSEMLNERLFSLIFTFTSFWYSNEFYSNFVDESFVSNEVSFDTYEELGDSGLQIYVEVLASDYAFNERLLTEIKWLREI
ncbi:uncharacterized protein LOC107980809 [Nasonia vitripennis]|uniref:Uncharacterized protein n=1 Tax=Nasonia vitripennis TaxID=7425 RepID=A0A7M7QBT9_NASVI|nr:uncharacterized protein LOC107980809 [Nasonia vitripennis]